MNRRRRCSGAARGRKERRTLPRQQSLNAIGGFSEQDERGLAIDEMVGGPRQRADVADRRLDTERTGRGA